MRVCETKTTVQYHTPPNTQPQVQSNGRFIFGRTHIYINLCIHSKSSNLVNKEEQVRLDGATKDLGGHAVAKLDDAGQLVGRGKLVNLGGLELALVVGPTLIKL